jgi:hypothetical protein
MYQGVFLSNQPSTPNSSRCETSDLVLKMEKMRRLFGWLSGNSEYYEDRLDFSKHKLTIAYTIHWQAGLCWLLRSTYDSYIRQCRFDDSWSLLRTNCYRTNMLGGTKSQGLTKDINRSVVTAKTTRIMIRSRKRDISAYH